jgi:hypothetical protein
MCQGQEPTGSEQFVLRRIHRSHVSDSGNILWQGFAPSREDTDGISVYFASSISPEALAASGRGGRENYYVARLPIQALRDLGLTLVPDDDDGHAAIPELSRARYKSEKAQVKEILFRLSKLANENIVFKPLPSQPS